MITVGLFWFQFLKQIPLSFSKTKFHNSRTILSRSVTQLKSLHSLFMVTTWFLYDYIMSHVWVMLYLDILSVVWLFIVTSFFICGTKVISCHICKRVQIVTKKPTLYSVFCSGNLPWQCYMCKFLVANTVNFINFVSPNHLDTNYNISVSFIFKSLIPQ